MNAPTGDQRSTDVDERSNSWPSSGLRIRNDPSGPFYYVKSLPALLAKLHITPQQVQTATTRNQSQSAYRVRYISSHGRKRQLEIPEDRDVRHVQGRIAQLLGPASGLLRENIYGYVPGRQALSMAMAHSGNGYLLHLDIRQFFRNCTLDAITKGLEEIGAHPDIAEFIAATCTYRGYLPTGARTSPVLSNILFIPLDDQLATLATENGVKYTRYADDLFFSAPTLAQLESLRVKAKMVLEDSGFQTSPRKEYLGKIEMAPKIVGVRFDNQSQPRIPRKLRRRLTSDFLAWERYIERQSNWEECCISQGDWIKSETEAPKQPNSTWSEVIGRAYYCFRIDPEWLMKMMDKYPNARKSIWDARRHRTPRRDLAMAAIPLTLIEHSPGIGHEVILVDERGSVDPLVRLLAARRTPTPCPPAPEGVA